MNQKKLAPERRTRDGKILIDEEVMAEPVESSGYLYDVLEQKIIPGRPTSR